MSKVNKFEELADRYMEVKGEDLSQEEWEMFEKLVPQYKKVKKKEAIKLFESLFCSLDELEEMERELEAYELS